MEKKEKAWGPHFALELAEILVEIFDYLEDDPPSLVAAILVNQKWFLHGTSVLWKEAPCKVLAGISANRRQFYASKIRSLTFDGREDSYHPLFKDLEFTSLKKVSIDTYRPAEGETLHLRQYLQPPLEEFLFYGGDIEHGLLDHLKTTCWRLRKILIDLPGPHITPSAFLEFLQGCSSLESMTFIVRMDHLITEETWLYMAGRENLRDLELGASIGKGTIENISTRVPTPFKALRKLVVTAPAEAVPSLVDMVKSLTTLHLTIEDQPLGVLEQVSQLTDIRYLALFFTQPTQLSTDELLSLGRLVKLEALDLSTSFIRRDNTAGLSALDLTDADFDRLLSHLGHLRSLTFQVQCSLSAAALESFSRRCPFLMYCEILPTFDLQTLHLEDRPAPMFPRLGELTVGGFEAPEDNDPGLSHAVRLAQLIRRHFPKLEYLYVENHDEFSNAVVNAFDEIPE
ncbi:hypothetical protein VTN77DRAFT_1639 [Rasamsonia byssochlamydoides]|uniref:uncharacterized protein n=1 Tax=Rasamsonia byssochlamydoides TaxID=89139 RepID=UPI0037425C9B